ncbi:MAG: helix-turn-helix domain containing protein [Parvibaculaceae bacterium]|nr:helix-turn-helix domain containing protein [Parvibaculaceae bacterium]HBM89565.1 TetR/AcrR family transcriptional regulator [Rhodobiaceae bacterium]
MVSKESKTYLAGVAAAKRLFSERGYDAVSTAEIRQAAGMSNGSLFHHFENKEGIAVAVFVTLVRTYQAEIAEKIGPTRRAADGIDAFIRTHNLWIERDPDGARILFNGQHPSWSDTALKRIRAENQGFGQTLQDWKNNLDDKDRLQNWSLALILATLVGPTQVMCRAWLSGQSKVPPSENIENLVRLAQKALLS